VFVVVYFITDSVQKLLDTPLYKAINYQITYMLWLLTIQCNDIIKSAYSFHNYELER